jgi:alkylation response protein AidB-like acyl-CoA dehydrogenase
LDFSFSDYELAFQEELTKRLLTILPNDWNEKSFTLEQNDPEFNNLADLVTKNLSKDKLLTLAWPEKYGGLGSTNLKQTMFNHVISYLGTPLNNIAGIQWIGPSLMMYGNEEQKKYYLPRIAEAVDKWCLLYSEPTSGSDLASLQTHAKKDGDNYIINGQKIWASNANEADFGLVAVRTNPNVSKHKGLSNFILPMNSRGISINPIEDINGNQTMNEVFFDNVVVSKKYLLGEENRGWYQMASSLDFERSGIGTYSTAKRNIEKLIEISKSMPEVTNSKQSYREELANRWIELNTGYNLAMKIPLLQDQGRNPTYEAAISKLYGSELTQKIASTGIKLLGIRGQIQSNKNSYQASSQYLSAIASTITRGTSEIQRNTIATQGLGLPR